jgi:long-chain acyl-CoA synthetase
VLTQKQDSVTTGSKLPRTLIDLYRVGFRTGDKAAAFLTRLDGQYRAVPPEEAEARVQSLAAGLLEVGARPGDRIAILSETRLEWALADLAILTAAAVTVPVFPSLPESQIESLLADAQPAFAFCSGPENFEHLLAIWPHLNSLRAVVLLDGATPARPTPGRVVPMAEFEAAGRRRLERDPSAVEERAATVTPQHLASLIYTSGTTGEPKGVMLTHANFVANVLQAQEYLRVGATDLTLSHLPLSHIFERMAGLYTPIYSATTVAYAEGFETLSTNVLEVRPTVVMSVPRLFEFMLERAERKAAHSGWLAKSIFAWTKKVATAWSTAHQAGAVPAGLAAARVVADFLVFRKLRARLGGRIRFFVSGGAPLPVPVSRFFHAAGIPIMEGYGLTETSPALAVNGLLRWRIGSVGPPLPGIDIRIADDGEILARGPNVMKGYYRRPEDTAAVITPDGWFKTGDIGFLDADGFLFITDRKKDVIVTASGKNIAPQPIERLLRAIPMVAEAVVIGDRRPHLVALLVPRFEELEAYARAEGIEFTGRADLVSSRRVRAFFRHEIDLRSKDLAGFERVRRFALLERELTMADGEMTPTLKVRRQRVAETWAKAIEGLYGG